MMRAVVGAIVGVWMYRLALRHAIRYSFAKDRNVRLQTAVFKVLGVVLR